MIIGLSGYARSGKDTVADFLVKQGFTKASFANPIRESLYSLNPFVSEDGVRLHDAIKEHGWDGYKNSQYSAEIRQLLQRFGTEVGRDIYGEDFWVDLMLEDIKGAGGDFVITDVRFENEADAIVQQGGEIWRINRPDVEPVNSHWSEVALDKYEKFAVIIDNSSTIEDLFTELANTFPELGNHNGN